MNYKNIFQIYVLLVCFISILVMIITAGYMLDKVTDIIIPEYKYYSHLTRFDSDESFLQAAKKDAQKQFDEVRKDSQKQFDEIKALSRSQRDILRNNERKEYLEHQKRLAIEGLITALGWAIVSAIFFFIHWRLHKKYIGK